LIAQITFQELEKAVHELEIVHTLDRKTIREKYLSFVKTYHPDTIDGNKEKFQAINDAYHLLISYIENYKFEFSKEEFKKQYPFSEAIEGDWLYKF
jgi:DnaJ-class molecular chaperone